MKRAFGERLKRAFPRGETVESKREDWLRDALLRREERLRERRGSVELPAGDTVENERGSCYVRRLRYPLSELHGDHALSIARQANIPRLRELAKLDDRVAIDLDQCLFLDTETTGLSGGAGTVVFMVGLGFFDGDELVLEQTFLRGYGEEPAALEHVALRMREYPQFVTFVGKSFDRHRIAARMAVNKMRSRALSSRHLDLYYMARRVWKDELPNCKLQTIESHKLGVHRVDDLPGSAAPIAFLDWIRDGSGAIDRVFEHNRLDVLTLVTLLGRLGR